MTTSRDDDDGDGDAAAAAESSWYVANVNFIDAVPPSLLVVAAVFDCVDSIEETTAVGPDSAAV